MKKFIATLIICAAVMPLAAQTEETLDPEFGGRIAAGIDTKLKKGLHLIAEEEIRMDNNFASLDRLQTTVGLNYKATESLKLGVGLAMINHYDADDKAFDNTRFRLMLDGTYGWRFGDWRLSIKERLQATVRTGDYNKYQSQTLGASLKSRLKLQYKGWRSVEPYAYVEMRNTLFSPVIAACYDSTTALYYTTGGELKGEAGWFIDSYTGCYVNRVRGSLGMDWKLDKRSSLNIAVLADYVMDKVIDSNSEGTKLKSYKLEKGFIGWLTAGYVYSF